MTNLVTIAIKKDIGWIKIDNPPVNATSTPVRAGLLSAIEAVKNCKLAVLYCAGRSFVAGGDMSEFDAPPAEPHLPDIVNAIENSPVPFLALLHGNVLGAGFEIAAACAFRVAKPDTRFGLPEVKVGLIPGAGGTQRAPRLLGWEMAFDMACLGQIKTASALFAVGAIDAIFDDFDQMAEPYMTKQAVPISHKSIPMPASDILEQYRLKIERAAKGQQAPLLNFEALKWAVEPFDHGQPKERALHLKLRHSAESRALRYMFFAERKIAKPPILKDIQPCHIAKIGIIGGGLMGSGIAMACLMAGYEVAIIEQDEPAIKAAKARVNTLLRGALERGKISENQFNNYGDDLIVSRSYDALADSDLVIEAVFEDIEVKQNLFSKVAQRVSDKTILATNTSYLDPNAIFADIENQQRCVGIHFFSPAHLMKLVEVIKADHTSKETLATAFSLANHLRKMPVLSGVCDGFIGNRILTAYRRAAEYLLADGALPDQIDQAMRDFGMAMGPYEAQDMSGLQIAEANRRRQDKTRNPMERYVPIADYLCAAGRYGQRTGLGWYRYETGSQCPRNDDAVKAIILDYSNKETITRRAFNDLEIQEFLLAVMANEGAHIVAEGIAQEDAAIDIVKVSGYGFPRWRGGPMYWSMMKGNEYIAGLMRQMMEMSPSSWVIAERFQTYNK